MTSLTGASGEDFASILRSLGYRMDRRPKPPEAEKSRRRPRPRRRLPHPKLRRKLLPTLRPPTPSPGSTHRRWRPTPSPSRKHRRSETPAVESNAPADSPAEPPAIRVAAAERGTDNSGSHACFGRSPAPTDAAPAVPAEPEMIEVWRPGRPSGERRPREGERRGRRRHHERPARPRPTADGQPLPVTPPWLRPPQRDKPPTPRRQPTASARSATAARGIAASVRTATRPKVEGEGGGEKRADRPERRRAFQTARSCRGRQSAAAP